LKESSLNELVEFEQNETILFVEAGIEITFTGAGTATMDNDDVISDAAFIISCNGKLIEAGIESINGKPGTLVIDNFLITLKFADGYSQFCGLKLERL